ncbi:MAG: hypothetical protein HY911_02250 [Desulfobacterales bacterium]|nr:hypothetical protein [Desulfobacterales bacterium]
MDNPFTLVIDAPIDQQVIQRPDVLVRGTFRNITGRETGISVNGITALQFGNEFMVNHVPLAQEQNTITVTATDTAGLVYSQSLMVTADIPAQYITATPLPEASLSPYAGELRIAAPVRLQHSTVTIYGAGDVETIDGPPELFELNIDLPGLYRMVVSSVSWNSETFTDEVALLIYDAGQLDALLQSKWNAMKARLAAGDVAGAVSYYTDGTKADYDAVYRGMGDQLPQMANRMRPIELIGVNNGLAKYRIKRSEEHQGQTYDISYWVYFETGGDGIWKISRY